MKPKLHSLVIPLLICAGVGAFPADPVCAQTEVPPRPPNQAPPTNLSDVSGPFLGNITIPTFPLTTSSTTNFLVVQLDNVTVDIANAPEQADLGPVLTATVQLSSTMDGLMPFAGCSNVNWRTYNEAVRDAKELKRALAEAIAEQKKTYSAAPAPEQKKAWTQRLLLIEQTTNALDGTTKALAYLGSSMDSAR